VCTRTSSIVIKTLKKIHCMWEAQQTASSVVFQTLSFLEYFYDNGRCSCKHFWRHSSNTSVCYQQIVPDKIYTTKILYSDRSTMMYHTQSISLMICMVYPWWYAGYITGDIQVISLVICKVYYWWYARYITDDIQGISLVICKVYHWWYAGYITGEIQDISLVIYSIYHWKYTGYITGDIQNISWTEAKSIWLPLDVRIHSVRNPNYYNPI